MVSGRRRRGQGRKAAWYQAERPSSFGPWAGITRRCASRIGVRASMPSRWSTPATQPPSVRSMPGLLVCRSTV